MTEMLEPKKAVADVRSDAPLSKGQIDVLVDDRIKGLTPRTRRGVIIALGVVALSCVAAEVILAIVGAPASDALMAVASGAVGGISGLAMPSNEK